MHKLSIKEAFTYFHKGYDRKDYVAGQEVDTDDNEFAAVATGEGWAIDGEKAAKPPQNKARKAAPENKSAE